MQEATVLHPPLAAPLTAPLPASVPADASPLADYAYSYDLEGRKTSETRTGGGLASETSSYLYDELGRLKQVTLPSGVVRSYSFDLDSNRTQISENGSTVASYSYDPQATAGVDQLSSVTGAGVTRSFAYNADGDTTGYGDKGLSWDGWGRHSGGTFGGQSVSYQFDPAGFRRQRTSGGSVTRYLLGGLFETDNTGTIGLADVDGPAGDLAHYSGPPATNSTVSYLYYNGHGDLAAEAGISGDRTAAFTYDPFGAPLQAAAANKVSERWTGRWDKKYDASSALIEMGVRPYDPGLGRFLSVDPVDGGALNNYDYALQDPINGYDLDGRCAQAQALCQAIWGALRGAAKKAPKAAAKAKVPAPRPSPTLGPMSAPQQAAFNAIVNDADRMKHIFKPTHHLDNMVHLLGSQQAVVREVVMNVGRVPTSGQSFSVLRIVSGSVLQVTGSFVNGVLRISNFWRPFRLP